MDSQKHKEHQAQTKSLPLQITSIILSQPVKVLARWWNVFDSWDWPEDLPVKPVGWDEMVDFFPAHHLDRGIVPTRYDWISPACQIIRDNIGLKECLQYHHRYNLDRTDEEFEHWWATVHFTSYFPPFLHEDPQLETEAR